VGILAKTTAMNFKRLLHPRSVNFTTFEGEVIDDETSRNVKTYIILWIVIVVLSTLILSLDFSGATVNGVYYDGLYSNFSATLACIGNIGPGFEMVGPMMNYAFYSPFSKLLLSTVMLIGRLEIFPMLILFAPRTWKKA
jgi:trk system potassium uptake protein TrkH